MILDCSATRGARLARGATAASTATVIAALSHALGGGRFPAAPLLLVGFLFAVIVCTALAGRAVSLARVIPAVGVSQLLFHLLFATAGDVAVTHSMHHGAVSAMTAGAAVTQAHGHTSMLAAHVLAALVTAIALRFGEAAFWGLFGSLRLALAVLHRARPVALGFVRTPRSLAIEPVDLRAAVEIEHLLAAPHRGPPALSVA